MATTIPKSESQQQQRRRRSIQWAQWLGLAFVLENDGDSLSDLPPESYVRRYQELCERHQCTDDTMDTSITKQPQMDEEEDQRILRVDQGNDPDEYEDDMVDIHLDPLSAIVQEQDAFLQRQQEMERNYRKERALRKKTRNQMTGGGANASCKKIMEDEPVAEKETIWMQQILKDVQRLPQSHQRSSNNGNPNQTMLAKSPESLVAFPRLVVLQRILYVFACQHPHAGYLQGMHEIASHVLDAIETEECHNDSSTMVGMTTTTTTKNSVASTTEKDQSDNNPPDHQNSKVACMRMEALCYFMAERILVELFPAYDVVANDDDDVTIQNEDTSALLPKTVPSQQQQQQHMIKPPPSPPISLLAAMSQRILHHVQRIWPELFTVLQAAFVQIPAPILFTKWIRILYAREIISNVLQLWDAMFLAGSELRSMESTTTKISIPPVPPLQRVAEALAAARLWHHGYDVMELRPYPNLLLHWFMNLPPEPEDQVDILITRMRIILFPEQSSSSSTMSSSLSLLPMPVSAHVQDILAQQQQLHQQQVPQPGQSILPNSTRSGSGKSPLAQQQQQQLTNSPLDLSTLEREMQTRFSSFADKLAAKTQFIQKRITQEWESIQEQQQKIIPQYVRQPQQHDDSFYNLDYHNHRALLERRQRQASEGAVMTASPVQPAAATPAVLTLPSDRLFAHWNILQEYVVASERRSGIVAPAQVWEALADLQRLQQEMKKENR